MKNDFKDMCHFLTCFVGFDVPYVLIIFDYFLIGFHSVFATFIHFTVKLIENCKCLSDGT